MNTPRSYRTLAASLLLLVGLTISTRLIFGGPVRTEVPASQVAEPVTPTALTSSRSDLDVSNGYVGTKPIETLRVGDRVLAHNPEVSQTERDAFAEPNWNEWLHLSLVMPKSDGSMLKIDLLRPETWVRQQIRLVVAPVAPDPPMLADQLPATVQIHRFSWLENHRRL